MSRQARADTAPEMALRRLLHGRGKRYRVSWPVPGLRRRTIDIAFTRSRVAVNVHGCFWHGCPEHGTWPVANAAWWKQKIDQNKVRDAQTRRYLEDLGWTVLEIWEHEPPEVALGRVLEALSRRRVRNFNALTVGSAHGDECPSD
ncbi:very short patch repair endonuclease [Modestobacter sp. VKM Ac-2978]|uniref:very short patch repair endonuclease n=1 Tax=Modestobacter sp. VKM Ac-2978 TaxID=3004132 RepID=UPI0022AA21E2|nr:very short patch repair endonuclease [Modestobacter sp. VKM Ac-2978]MCZ2849138.1 very short patch repair endonuclease [Modestobacter sp. VKM Ac-2978]